MATGRVRKRERDILNRLRERERLRESEKNEDVKRKKKLKKIGTRLQQTALGTLPSQKNRIKFTCFFLH